MRFLLLALFCAILQGGNAASKINCPANEEYMGLGSCEATCANPNRECDWISTLFHLIPGCRCRADKGFVRNGRLSPLAPCIKAKDCPKKETPPPECASNTVYRECGSCEGSCYYPNPVCTQECRKPGCYCPVDQGYVRSPADGSCIPFWKCPPNANTWPIATGRPPIATGRPIPWPIATGRPSPWPRARPAALLGAHGNATTDD